MNKKKKKELYTNLRSLKIFFTKNLITEKA